MPTTENQPPPSTGSVDELLATAKPFMQRLDRFLDDIAEEFEPELRELVDYALSHSGKRLRPLSLFLVGAGAEGNFDESLIRAAAVVELVHLATLVHDDILDDAELRHEQATIAKRFGTPAAVLLGDALFAQSLHLASEFPTTEVCRIVSEATRKICAGEIEQTLDPQGTNTDRDRYFRIIERKTAVLFEASCRLGALLGAPGPEMADAAGDFGLHLGLAYQIYDDLIDIAGTEESVGKTLGTDFASGKGTLPFLLLLEGLDGNEKDWLEKHLNGNGNEGWSAVRRMFAEKNIIDRVAEIFGSEIEQARRAASLMPLTTGGERLAGMADFVESRFKNLRR